MAGASPRDASPVVIEMRGVTKTFPGIVADDDVNFGLKEGEIHGLLGENGAGKTVLMSVLFGLYKPDKGEIFVKGKKADIRSPKDAIKTGIGMVHQQFMLVEPFSVTENIVLGLRSTKEPILDTQESERKVLELSQRYGLAVNPRARVKDLSAGERQRVEILKALFRGCKVLILDEPTTMLTPQETESLFKTLRKMVDEGLSIIFITHKIPEVLATTDRVTVLRAGRVVATLKTSEVDERTLATMMVGAEMIGRIRKKPVAKGKVTLRVGGLWARGDENTDALKNVSLDVRQGEILGVAGVAGNGQKELAECIMGLRLIEKGTITLDGETMSGLSPRQIIGKGVAWIPADRQRAIVEDFSLEENFVLKNYYNHQFSKGWMLRADVVRRFARDLISEYEIKTPSSLAKVSQLSGGNIQRLIVARELSQAARLIVAENPTSGLDIKLTELVHRRLVEQKEKGVAVLLVSSDLDEILSITDRITVMYKGEIIGTLEADEAKIDTIGLMMAGGAAEEGREPKVA